MGETVYQTLLVPKHCFRLPVTEPLLQTLFYMQTLGPGRGPGLHALPLPRGLRGPRAPLPRGAHRALQPEGPNRRSETSAGRHVLNTQTTLENSRDTRIKHFQPIRNGILA